MSDDDDVQEISPPKANSRTTPTTKKSDKQIRVYVLCHNQGQVMENGK